MATLAIPLFHLVDLISQFVDLLQCCGLGCTISTLIVKEFRVIVTSKATVCHDTHTSFNLLLLIYSLVFMCSSNFYTKGSALDGEVFYLRLNTGLSSTQY